MAYSWATVHAKADNRVPFANKPWIVWSKLSWIHRMASVADRHPESANSEHHTVYNFVFYSILQYVSTRTTNLHTALHILHILFLLLYRDVRGNYCGHDNDCQGNMKCRGKTQAARCR